MDLAHLEAAQVDLVHLEAVLDKEDIMTAADKERAVELLELELVPVMEPLGLEPAMVLLELVVEDIMELEMALLELELAAEPLVLEPALDKVATEALEVVPSAVLLLEPADLFLLANRFPFLNT